MPPFNSRISIFKIKDTGGTLRDLSIFILSLDGLPGERPLDKVTAIGASGESFIPGVENVRYKLTGNYDDKVLSGPEAVLGPLRTHSSEVDFEYHPVQEGSGTPKYTGKCWVTTLRLIPTSRRLIQWEAWFQVEGVVTRGTN